MEFQSHEVFGLEVTVLIDGAVGSGGAILHDENRFVGPVSGLLERGPGRWIDKNIIEHRMLAGCRGFAVAHVEASAQENPLAIILRREQGAFGVIARRAEIIASCAE